MAAGPGCCALPDILMNTPRALCRHKACIVEPRDSALFPQAAEDFKSKLNDPNYHGAVFFAVCR